MHGGRGACQGEKKEYEEDQLDLETLDSSPLTSQPGGEENFLLCLEEQEHRGGGGVRTEGRICEDVESLLYI